MDVKKLHKGSSKIAIVIVSFIVILFVASKVHYRFDLTSEKRYTLSETTKKVLDNVADTIHFKVYLDGDLPISFYRLRSEIKDQLEEFTEIAGNHITFEFVNPANDDDQSLTQKTYEFLSSNGLIPFTIEEKDDKGKQTSRVVFPGAIVTSRNKLVSINFLKTSALANSDQNINNAVQGIEYELVNAIRKLSVKQKSKVAFLTGHGELDRNQTASLAKALDEYYTVERVKIDSSVLVLQKYKSLIIAKPTNAFSEIDKLAIDQFVMNGGHVVWLLDLVNVPEDSLAYERMVLGLANQLNLDDQLFRYGVRINYNVILDNQCAVIPLNVAAQGAQPQWNPSPWFFHPLISPPSTNPITKNLNVIKVECASVIDTVGEATDHKATVLLRSSDYSKVLATPVPVSFDLLEQTPNQYFFDKYNLPIGVLLEGTFESIYKNRMLPKLRENIKIVNHSKQTSMIVIADGDIARNEVRKLAYDTIPQQLGYDRYTKETYGNKDFMLNAVNYLCDDAGLLNIRSRELKIRLLNKTRITDERTMWQVINILGPIVMLIVFGISLSYVRKRKNRKN